MAWFHCVLLPSLLAPLAAAASTGAAAVLDPPSPPPLPSAADGPAAAEERARVAVGLLEARAGELRRHGRDEAEVQRAASEIEHYVNATYVGVWIVASHEFETKLGELSAFEEAQMRRKDLVDLAEARKVREQAKVLRKAVEHSMESLDKLDRDMPKDMRNWCGRQRRRVRLSLHAQEREALLAVSNWMAVENATSVAAAAWAMAKLRGERLGEQAKAASQELAHLTADHLKVVEREVDRRALRLQRKLKRQHRERRDDIEEVQRRVLCMEAEQNRQALQLAFFACDAAETKARAALHNLDDYAAWLQTRLSNGTWVQKTAQEIIKAVGKDFAARRAQADEEFNKTLAKLQSAAGTSSGHRTKGRCIPESEAASLKRDARRTTKEQQRLDDEQFRAMWHGMGKAERRVMAKIRELEHVAMSASHAW